ncbi:MAG: hypothetical protein KDB22_09400 [Planctomycetales bacterium]|nr:hypothetical protein [Planctomycetales bacterium]
MKPQFRIESSMATQCSTTAGERIAIACYAVVTYPDEAYRLVEQLSASN